MLFVISSSQLGVILLPRGHLTMSEGIFGYCNLARGHLVDREWDTAKRRIMDRTAPTIINYLPPNASGAENGKPCFGLNCSNLTT